MASAFRLNRISLRRLCFRSLAFGLAGMAAIAAAAPGRASAAGEQWFLLKIGGTPVGYVREASAARGAGAASVFVSDSTMKMTINRLGSKVAIEVVTRSEETADGRLRKIGYEMRASALATKSEAVVKDTAVEVRTEAGGKSYPRTIPYTGILIGPEGVRRLSLEKIRKPGDKIEYQTFSSESETVSKGSQTALAWEDLSLGGRTIRALKVEETLASDSVKTTSWLDEKRDVLRQESPTPFGIAEIVLSTREEALRTEGGGSLPEELYTRSIIRTNIRLPQARTIGHLKVRLTAKDASVAWPEFPGPSPKTVGRTAKTLDLEIRRPDAPISARLPLPVTGADREFLEPNAYIQSDDPALRAVAVRALAGETDAWKAGLKLERWVAENMSFDLGIAIAPSSELFKNRRGTCLGYATLLATLLRAVGIPSRVVIGYVYALGMFGGHAWTEVCIGGAWAPLDAAIVAPGVADAARVGLSASSFRDGAGSLVSGPAQSIFGRVDIRILEYARASGAPIVVPETASPYTIEGEIYRNPWLGLSLVKPKGFAFGKLDAVWPDATVVEMKGPDEALAALQEGYLLPWVKPEEAAAEALARFAGKGKPERGTKNGRTVLRLAQGENAAAAVLDGPVFWLLTVAARNAAVVLTEMLGGLSYVRGAETPIFKSGSYAPLSINPFNTPGFSPGYRAGLFLLPALAAQQAAAPISRAQFAAAYLRFETALQGATLGPADAIRVNRSFDALTLLFFTGNLARAMENLNALTDSIDPQAPPTRSVDLEARQAKAESMRAEAASIKARIEALAPMKPGLIQAQAAAAARADLLAQAFDAANTAQALMDPAALLAQVRLEAAELARGKNPFAGRKGDYWRVIKTGERTIPVRVFCPAEADAAKPLPLIIAFHGSGGDENMFMDGYGAGLIKKLAAERKAVLATPRTEPFAAARGAEAFDDLLSALGADYPIDPKQVFVLGHSMGGMATNALLITRGEKIAAAACLCGFQGFAAGAAGIPPTLVVAGELDPIVSQARIEPAFQKARAAGFPVEYRLIPNYGHTLTVGKVLPEVVAWLSARGRRRPRP